MTFASLLFRQERKCLMPTVDERLRHVTLKIERTKKHVTDLETESRAFAESNRIRANSCITSSALTRLIPTTSR